MLLSQPRDLLAMARNGLLPESFFVAVHPRFRTFFFSSRRRHTRLTCDWRSDVCSSDLATACAHFFAGRVCRRVVLGGKIGTSAAELQIGRASRRERAHISPAPASSN